MSPESVTDEHILAGFKSLHEAMTSGFDSLRGTLRKEMDERFNRVDERIGGLHQRIGDLDHRVMKRFDEVDERFDRVEERLAKLETRRPKRGPDRR